LDFYKRIFVIADVCIRDRNKMRFVEAEEKEDMVLCLENTTLQ